MNDWTDFEISLPMKLRPEFRRLLKESGDEVHRLGNLVQKYQAKLLRATDMLRRLEGEQPFPVLKTEFWQGVTALIDECEDEL